MEGLEWKMGQPRYLPKVSLLLMPKIEEREKINSTVQLDEKITLDLIELIFWPDIV